MPKDKLFEFIKGFSGAVELYKRANQNGSFIESVCLGASIIDGALRIGIILKHQINTKSTEQISELLQQAEDDKIITERQVYKMAIDNEVIDQIIFDELEKLYKQRNRVVHRYIISEITTDEVLKIAIEYDNTIKTVNNKIEELEKKQIEMGVGMTVYGEDQENKELIDNLGKAKHGNDELAKKLREKLKEIGDKSFNFTKAAEEKNAENLLIINNKDLAKIRQGTGKSTGSILKCMKGDS